MFAIQPTPACPGTAATTTASPANKQTPRLTPHLLPCRIHHSGRICTSRRYWNPTPDDVAAAASSSSSTATAFLRGRKLRGRITKLPEGYTGVVLKRTEDMVSSWRQQQQQQETADRAQESVWEDEEDEVDKQEVKRAELMGAFDHIVVWGHEALPEKDHLHLKGVQEWINFAETMHTYYDAPSGSKS